MLPLSSVSLSRSAPRTRLIHSTLLAPRCQGCSKRVENCENTRRPTMDSSSTATSCCHSRARQEFCLDDAVAHSCARRCIVLERKGVSNSASCSRDAARPGAGRMELEGLENRQGMRCARWCRV